MDQIVIVREGDKEKIVLNDGQEILLGTIKQKFVKNKAIVFVGMCTFPIGQDLKDRVVLFSLPKYFPKSKCNEEHLNDIRKHLLKICRVIEKLRNNEGKSFEDDEYLFAPYELKKSGIEVNRFDLAEFIINDYLQNGLYFKDQTDTIKGGFGRINWAKTLSRIYPIIQDQVPIYTQTMNKYHRSDDNDLVSLIHANIVNQCLDFLGPLISCGIEKIEIDNLGDDLSSYVSIINSRSTYVFKEREINLFKALEAWCGLTKYYDNYPGVTCFDKVWEWVNDSVWGNLKKTESEKPVYTINSKKYYGTGDAIPDTVRIETINYKKEVFIFDSKYYTVKSIYSQDGDFNIKGLPSNADIAKQVAYLWMIKNLYEANLYNNAFLLPEYSESIKGDEKEIFTVTTSDWFKGIGFVRPGKFNYELKGKKSINEDDRVVLIIENPDKLYDKYLNNEKATYSDLEKTKIAHYV